VSDAPSTTTTTVSGKVPDNRSILERFAPDTRTLWIILMFILVIRVFGMIEHNPKLLDDSPFMEVVTLLVGTGGVGLISTFLFGGTQSGAKVMETQNQVVTAAAAPPVTTTTTTTSAP
jgi:hypothetical protein